MEKQALPKKGVVIPEKIHLLAVNIVNAQVNSSITNAVGWDDITLNMGSEILFNEDYLCRLSLVLDMENVDDSGAKLIKANFSIDFDFQIENIMELIVVDEASKTVISGDRELGVNLIAIAYSTARGIVLTRTAGTVLNGLILPVVDTARLFDLSTKK